MAFLTNLSGCLLIGVLMVLMAEVWAAHRLLRPFLGTGVLGGYTTLSSYSEQTRALAGSGHTGLAGLYLVGTLAACLLAVTLASRWSSPAEQHVFADEGGDE